MEEPGVPYLRQDVRLTVLLTVAAQSTSVDVTSGADQINTENGTLSDSKDNLQMTQLPLNNRATTTSPLGALGLSPNVQTDSSGNIALDGASSSMVNFSVDGISTANLRQNGALQDAYPSQEGIAAVKVTAFNNSAEFSQVGDVTFTTKNGTNNYRGRVFECLQNQALDAIPYGFSGKSQRSLIPLASRSAARSRCLICITGTTGPLSLLIMKETVGRPPLRSSSRCRRRMSATATSPGSIRR
jgi:hypothetical protein